MTAFPSLVKPTAWTSTEREFHHNEAPERTLSQGLTGNLSPHGGAFSERDYDSVSAIRCETDYDALPMPMYCGTSS
jgi:hypothetical protein